MPKFATSYEIRTDPPAILIDGVEVPWLLAAQGPSVQALSDHQHILWLPVLMVGVGLGEGAPDADPLQDEMVDAEIVEVEDQKRKPCWACHGDGHPNARMGDCLVCDGTGQIDA